MSDMQSEQTGGYLLSGKPGVSAQPEKILQRAIDRGVRQKGAVILSWWAAVNNRLLDYYAGIVLLVLWELAPRLKWIDSQFFPAPTTILAEAVKLASTGELLIHVAVSLQRTLQGLLLP